MGLRQFFNRTSLTQFDRHRAVAVDVDGGDAAAVGGLVADGVVLRFGDDGERGIGADGFIRTAGGTQSEQQQEGVSLHSVSIMVVGNVAFEMVTRSAVGAFDVAVGLNREEDARMTVPSFVVGAGAVQRQVFGVDNDGFGVCVHDFSLVSPTLLYDISPACAAQKVV